MNGNYPSDVVKFSEIATLVFTIVNVFTMLIRPIFIVFGQIPIANLSVWINPVIYLSSFIVLILLAPNAAIDARAVALCQFASGLVVLAGMLIKLQKLVHLCFPKRKQLLNLLLCTSRIAPSEIISNAAGNLDRVALVPIVSPAELGIYSVAFSLSRVLTIIQVALSSVFLPALSKISAVESKDLIDRVYRCACLVMASAIFFLFLIGDRLIVFMYGKEFAGSSFLLIALSCEACVGCLVFILSQIFLLRDDPHFLSIVQLISLLIAALGFGLIVWFGTAGAAVALLIAGFVRLFLLLLGVRFRLQLRLPTVWIRKDDLLRIVRLLISR